MAEGTGRPSWSGETASWGAPVPPAPSPAPADGGPLDGGPAARGSDDTRATPDRPPRRATRRSDQAAAARATVTDGSRTQPAGANNAEWATTGTATRTRPPLRPEGRPPARAPIGRDRGQPLRPDGGRPDSQPPAETIRVGWRDRRRVRIVERFSGRGVRAKTGWWRRVRSIVFLLVIGAILCAVVAAILAASVAGIALALHHLSKG